MTMHGGQTGFTRGFLQWWHNGWAWIMHMANSCGTASHLHDRAIGSLPSAKRLLPEALQWGYNDNLVISEKQNTLRGNDTVVAD